MNEKELTKNVKEFLEFRKKFNARDWHELTRAVQTRLDEKAAKLELDDFDLTVIAGRLNL